MRLNHQNARLALPYLRLYHGSYNNHMCCNFCSAAYSIYSTALACLLQLPSDNCTAAACSMQQRAWAQQGLPLHPIGRSAGKVGLPVAACAVGGMLAAAPPLLLHGCIIKRGWRQSMLWRSAERIVQMTMKLLWLLRTCSRKIIHAMMGCHTVEPCTGVDVQVLIHSQPCATITRSLHS